MAENFELRTVPAGEWRRLQGTKARGTDGARPHLVPITERAKKFIEFLAFTGEGMGLCPGEIRIGEAWSLAFRFVKIDDGAENEVTAMAEKMMEEMEVALSRE